MPPDSTARADGLDQKVGPVMRGGRRRRWPLVLGSVLLVLAVAGGGFTGGLVWYGTSQIERTEVEGLVSRKGPATTTQGTTTPEGTEILNVLIVGTDSRDNLSETQRESMGTGGPGMGARADTIMLAQMEVGGGAAALLSFPRDLWVERCDGSTGRINGANTISYEGRSGASCLVQTVTALSGIEINHYVEVDFDGFIKLVDVVGGVNMYFDEPLRDPMAGLDVPAGCQRLGPEQALAFVRARSLDSQGDFGRIARQQRFIREIVEEIVGLGVLANPRRLVSVVDTGARSVTTDSGLGLGDMRDIAMGMRGVTGDRVVGHTVPADPTTINGAAVLIPRDDESAPIYAAFRDGTAISGGGTVEVAGSSVDLEQMVRPADAGPIHVRNGTSVSGLAQEVGDRLAGLGYLVSDIGNAGTDVTTTVVRHSAAQAPAAEDLAAILGADTMVDASVNGTIVIDLGVDAAGGAGGGAGTDGAADVDEAAAPGAWPPFASGLGSLGGAAFSQLGEGQFRGVESSTDC